MPLGMQPIRDLPTQTSSSACFNVMSGTPLVWKDGATKPRGRFSFT
jgi:hypothetical protein